MYVCFFRVLAIFILLTQVSFAESLEEKQKALDIVADFADRMCTKVPLTGEGDNLELTGEGEAQLQGIIKKLANLGFKGAIKYQDNEYIGYLQKDLISALKNTQSCKLKILKDLKGYLLSPNDPFIVNIDGKILPIKRRNLDSVTFNQTSSQPLSSCTAVRSLAQEFGLLTETPPNIHLLFDTGDISFFCEQKWSENKLKLEFAARRVVLDAANDSKVIIKDKGTLSWAAQKVMSEIIQGSGETGSSIDY
ncbi:MAG: hypothetical protein PVI90_02495 [Desulfobacteraceae bacterium]|jgi:hypothetical protein